MAGDYSTYYFGLLAVLLLSANWPFWTSRYFFVKKPSTGSKSLAWHLLELLISFALWLVIAWWIEGRLGQRHSQDWEFYAVMLCLFFTFAFPGFVWRFLFKRSKKR